MHPAICIAERGPEHFSYSSYGPLQAEADARLDCATGFAARP
jgi:hypothetical protein